MPNNDQIPQGIMRSPILRLAVTAVGGSMFLAISVTGAMNQSPYLGIVMCAIVLLGIIYFSIGMYRYYSLKSKLNKNRKNLHNKADSDII